MTRGKQASRDGEMGDGGCGEGSVMKTSCNQGKLAKEIRGEGFAEINLQGRLVEASKQGAIKR